MHVLIYFCFARLVFPFHVYTYASYLIQHVSKVETTADSQFFFLFVLKGISQLAQQQTNEHADPQQQDKSHPKI